MACFGTEKSWVEGEKDLEVGKGRPCWGFVDCVGEFFHFIFYAIGSCCWNLSRKVAQHGIRMVFKEHSLEHMSQGVCTVLFWALTS